MLDVDVVLGGADVLVVDVDVVGGKAIRPARLCCVRKDMSTCHPLSRVRSASVYRSFLKCC